MTSEVHQYFWEKEETKQELKEDDKEDELEEHHDIDSDSYLKRPPLCPSCRQPFDLPLLLPCSHSLCRGCVLRAAPSSTCDVPGLCSHPPQGLWSCALLCPDCRFTVELPSKGWGEAVHSLPVNPALQGLGQLGGSACQAGCPLHGRKWSLFFCEREGVLVCRGCRPGLLEDQAVVTLDDAWTHYQGAVLRNLQQAQEEIAKLKQETEGKELTARQIQEALGGGSDTVSPGVTYGDDRLRQAMHRLQCLEQYSAQVSAALREGDLPVLLQAASHWPEEDALGVQAALSAYPNSTPEGSAELLEEDMEKSVRGLLFTLDPQTAPPLLRVSPSGLTVTFLEQTHLDCCYRGTEAVSENQRAEPPHLPQVCAGVCINRGQFYWEVDVYNSASYRIGLCSVEGIQDWWFERQGSSFSVLYDGSREQLHSVPPQVKTLGVFLNLGGGAVSFHNTVVQEHLATLPTRFGGAVRPALCLGQGRLRIRCGLPPPPHVFSSCRSGYRSPRGSSRRGWHRDVPFHSVRSVIQKFEELSVSDSDSGLISSFGSCSTLNSSSSLLDPGK